MDKYIFLDNWVFSRLLDDSFSSRLSGFIRKRNYTILLTSTLLTELYNSKWQEAGDRDRGLKTVRFISKHASVIIDPKKVFDSEYLHFPKGLNIIPVELDLKTIEDELRPETLLGILRRDPLFLNQGRDIEKWNNGLNEIKRTWLTDAKRIMDHALQNGVLKQDQKGEIIVDVAAKEIALTSLDLRLSDNPDTDSFLSKASTRKNKMGKLPRLRGTRIVSLCYWYTFIEIDKANKLRQQGSDIVDHYHLGLIPYCSAFTLDTNMSRLLEYVAKDIDISRCDLYTPRTLAEVIASY
jgi:hypothetical protein